MLRALSTNESSIIIVPCGVVVSMSGFHPLEPGSIPGMETFFLSGRESPPPIIPFLHVHASEGGRRDIVHGHQGD